MPPSVSSLVRFARPQLQPQPQMPDVFKLDTPIFAWMRTRTRVYLDVNTSQTFIHQIHHKQKKHTCCSLMVLALSASSFEASDTRSIGVSSTSRKADAEHFASCSLASWSFFVLASSAVRSCSSLASCLPIPTNTLSCHTYSHIHIHVRACVCARYMRSCNCSYTLHEHDTIRHLQAT